MRQIESRVSKQRRRHLRRREDGDNFLSQRQGIQRELTEHGEHLLTYCTGYFSGFGQSLGTAEFWFLLFQGGSTLSTLCAELFNEQREWVQWSFGICPICLHKITEDQSYTLAARKRVCKFLSPYPVRYLVFLRLLAMYAFIAFLLRPAVSIIYIIASCPKMSISVLVF